MGEFDKKGKNVLNKADIKGKRNFNETYDALNEKAKAIQHSLDTENLSTEERGALQKQLDNLTTQWMPDEDEENPKNSN